jgi:hypothetical protein
MRKKKLLDVGTPVAKHVRDILVMSFILLSAFVG